MTTTKSSQSSLPLMIKYQYILLLCLLISCGKPHEKQPISSSIIETEWQFQSESEQIQRPAAVPSCVHLDLLKNNVIDDPYFENNELKQSWIENENWEYTSEFKIAPSDYNNKHIELEFEGLDTRAEVYLNDSLILNANNMFRSWKVQVKSLLKIGMNDLRIIFFSPVSAYSEELKNYPHRLPAGCEKADIQVSPFIRKAAYHFGWDWGPRFVTCGIWKPIRLNMWNELRINNIQCSTVERTAEIASVEVAIEIESAIDDDQIELRINGQKHRMDVEKGVNKTLTTLWYSEEDFWWPNGSGKQNLQQIEVELYDHGQLIERKSINYGVRTIELINEPDSIGTSFHFEVNGVPIFIKGANYIPQDVFIPRVKAGDYEELILKAKNANFNMLRVWGGGIYEKEYFYELCDKHGILIWQDLMFAGSMYPITEEFTNNVMEEVKDNVKRLRNHACIALWCGNNEVEVAWQNWGWQEQFGWDAQATEDLWNGYTSLFKTAIPNLLEELTPMIDYVSTSPLSNWGTPENFSHGSMHYWGVWHGKEPFHNFYTNVPRFMVEYGFQSFPDSTTLTKVIEPHHMSANNAIMSNRQKSYIGNGLITKHSLELFGPSDSFNDYIQNSQKTQAVAYKTAIRSHRLNRGHCMGTLFWQFNDCWQGPSWSVIDYNKKEKIAYGVVKEMYQPIAAFVEFTNDSVKISVISDRMDSTNIDLRLFAVSGDGTVKIWEENLVARPNQKQVVLLEPVKFFNLLGRSVKRIRLDMESSTGETFTDEIDIKL